MFDFSFSELALVAVVALVVLGPERLPKVARTAGHLLGRARSYANQVKADIDREMQMSELRKLQEEAQAAARSFENSVNEFGRTIETEAAKLENLLDGVDTSSARAAIGRSLDEDPLATSIAEQARGLVSTAPAARLQESNPARLDSPLAPAWPSDWASASARQADAVVGNMTPSPLAASPLGESWPSVSQPR